MKYKVFVDGQEGTTGLEINSRLQNRPDIEILKINPEKRKDIDERKRLLNEADIVFLCLPDDAARESVSLVTNPATKIIDSSTAHRTVEDWTYGLPELSPAHRKNVAESVRVSNPGCFATGFISLMYPLISNGIVTPDYPATCHAVTGYSGGGKSRIADYESKAAAAENKSKLNSPCFYALGLKHKHLPEMKKHSGLMNPPLFTPIIGGFYRGMTVAVPLVPDHMAKKISASELYSFFAGHYKDANFIKVLPFGAEESFQFNFLDAEGCNNTNNLEIMIFGHETQILAVARLDNLGKGASGAAVQNMNIMLGVDETTGLV